MDRFAVLATLLAAMAASGAAVVTAEERAAPAAPAEISFFDGSRWTALGHHDAYLKKAKADGPDTYVVLGGATSEIALSTRWPRFRIESDRAGAFRIHLARFEAEDQKRRTTIERVRGGLFFKMGIELELMEVAEGIWELIPTRSLHPGEYAFVVSDSLPAADFTIADKEH